MHDLHDLPKLRDSMSYLYLERCKIEQDSKAIAFYDAVGKTPVPVSSLTLLMLGPGTSITHAAIQTLADNGCMVMWCGEEGVRTYAFSMGETRSARRIIRQAHLVSNEKLRFSVILRMYQLRFKQKLDHSLNLKEIRGMEGMRVRNAYKEASELYGVKWDGRSYHRGGWKKTDPINRALSVANACLYGICHAAIVSLGYSPALGFIHSGKSLSFVYDIADLYKVEISIPLAFQTTAEKPLHLDREVRIKCRDYFRKTQILKRIAPDIEFLLDINRNEDDNTNFDLAKDPACPMPLWDPSGDKENANGSDYS